MRLASILLLGISLSPSAPGQPTGTIKGNVVDENGKPLVGAKVHVAPTDPFYGSRIVDFHETDASGRFEVKPAALGNLRSHGRQGGGGLCGYRRCVYQQPRCAIYHSFASNAQ